MSAEVCSRLIIMTNPAGGTKLALYLKHASLRSPLPRSIVCDCENLSAENNPKVGIAPAPSPCLKTTSRTLR